MGALAHYIETAGIPTTQISLIRVHTEKTNPPRALWVPFELGRPLGLPDDTAFQHRVLNATMELLNANAGPVLIDYPEDAPATASEDMDGWVCPMPVRSSAEVAEKPESLLLAEISSLQQWYDMFREKRGRSSVGACNMSLEDVAKFLAISAANGEVQSINGELAAAQVLKLGSEDLKAFYSEAALAMPGNKDARQIVDWIWGQTELGKTLLALRPICIESEDQAVKQVGQVMLVPHSHWHLAGGSP